MKQVRIYKPTKTAMQSGRGKTKNWIMSFGPDKKGYIDERLGWYGTADNDGQVHLSFDSKESALSYAQSQGFEAVIMGDLDSKLNPDLKSYSDNFAPTKRRFTVPS